MAYSMAARQQCGTGKPPRTSRRRRIQRRQNAPSLPLPLNRILLLLLATVGCRVVQVQVVHAQPHASSSQQPTAPPTAQETIISTTTTPPTPSYWGAFPSNITLRAGVMHEPPFSTIEYSNGTAETVYGGLQIDLIKYLVQYAARDNVTLTFDLIPAPTSFGAAYDLVSVDCDTVANLSDVATYDHKNCSSFDMIVADFYATPVRAMRAHLSPAWMWSTFTTAKLASSSTASPPKNEITTLQQATDANATVCLKSGTYYATIVVAEYPNTTIHYCPNTEPCIEQLQKGTCTLYVDDELQLRYQEAKNPALEVTRESFHTQYIVWPVKYTSVSVIARKLLEKWILQAVADAVLDDLYSTYFKKALCPIGKAGEHCELPCDPVHGAADKLGQCVCSSTKWTGADCSIEVPENKHAIPASTMWVSYGMLAINIIAIIVCGIWLFLHRQATQVVVSQPFFLCLVLLGCFISSCTILALGQYDDGYGPVPACMVIPWLYSVGFCVTFGTLFAKIRRVYLIFKSSMFLKRTMVSVNETLAVIGIVLLVDIIILIVWTVVDPLQWERTVISADQFGVPLESEGFCTSEHWGAFAGALAFLHLVLLLVACYMCYVSRDIPTKFSEGKYLSVAMVSNLQIFVVSVPVLFIIGGEPATSFFVRSAIVWMNDFVVVTLIFGNLIYGVHFHPQTGSEAITQALSQYSQSHRERSTRNSLMNRAGSTARVSISERSLQVSIEESLRTDRRVASPDRISFASRRSVDDSDLNASYVSNRQSASGEGSSEMLIAFNAMRSADDSASELMRGSNSSGAPHRRHAPGVSREMHVTFNLRNSSSEASNDMYPAERAAGHQGIVYSERCALCNTLLVKEPTDCTIERSDDELANGLPTDSDFSSPAFAGSPEDVRERNAASYTSQIPEACHNGEQPAENAAGGVAGQVGVPPTSSTPQTLEVGPEHDLAKIYASQDLSHLAMDEIGRHQHENANKKPNESRKNIQNITMIAARKLKNLVPTKGSLEAISEKTEDLVYGSLSKVLKEGDNGRDPTQVEVADVEMAPFDDIST